MPAPCPTTGSSLEGVDRDPPEVVAAGAAESRRSAAPGRWGTGCRSWRTGPRRGRRPRPRRADRENARAGARRAFSTRRVAGDLDRPPGHGPLAALEPAQQREEAERERRSRRAGSSSTVTPWSTDAWRRGCRRGSRLPATASSAGSAPRRADRQRRQQPEAVPGEGDQAAGGDRQREQPAARVGEVEGHEQDGGHGRHREPAQRRPSSSAGSSRAAAATAIPQSAPFAFQ